MKFQIYLLSFFTFSAQAQTVLGFDESTVSIPVVDSADATTLLSTRVCSPKNTVSANVVILNHGSPPNATDRPTMTSYACTSEPVQWFLAKGFIVVAPLRRGYGATGGQWAENYGLCATPDFVRAGLETARDISAVVKFVPSLTHAKPNRIVVLGQSAGGWGTIAFNSLPHPSVSAIINMAGGRGGHAGPKADQNCAPDLLTKSAAKFASTSTTPMIWIYAQNDSFFSPTLSKSMYDAFSNAGGKADYILKPPYQSDGHGEFAGPGGSLIWGPDIATYLAKQLAN